ncbi:putative glutathione-specific gamma-glutamylcyclotransferase 2 [Amphiura filiformis]|uniref:putative glutathione-specific gamma-glutamylcyclotransferase 2 n=1 Tax=Amphiura filiformis TaxID=82378 RepID=UPI003B21F9F9
MMWVFGYGSLIWRPDFPFKQKVVGYIKGYKRRFWQGSTRFRGVPGNPGRVVTLVKDTKECVWGVAYEVASEHKEQVRKYLDTRETGGYIADTVEFYPDWDHLNNHKKEPFKVLVYFSTPGGSNYLGPASIEDIARQIVKSSGPVGTNLEYLTYLSDFMRTCAPQAKDIHLFEIEAMVKTLMQ